MPAPLPAKALGMSRDVSVDGAPVWWRPSAKPLAVTKTGAPARLNDLIKRQGFPMTILVVRAGSKCEDASGNLANNRVSLAFDEPDASACASYEDVQKIVHATHLGKGVATMGRWAAALWIFRSPEHDQAIVVMPVDLDGKRVFAIGRVTGGYSFDASVRDRHRRSVQWLHKGIPSEAIGSDVRSRLGLPNSCYRIRKHDAEARLLAMADGKTLPGSPEEDIAAGRTPQDPVSEVSFPPEAFELLARLMESPKVETYAEIKVDLQKSLVGRMQELVTSIVEGLPAPILASEETEKQIFSRFLKNDYGQGGVWPYLWAAIYTKGASRVTSSQLFLHASQCQVSCGFSIGESAGGIRQRFRANAFKNRAELQALLAPWYDEAGLVFGEDADEPSAVIAFKDWLNKTDHHGYRACAVFDAAAAGKITSVQWQETVLALWSRLYPLVLLANNDNPMPVIRDYIEQAKKAGWTDDPVLPDPSGDDIDENLQIDQMRAGMLMQTMLKVLDELGGSAKRGVLLNEIPTRIVLLPYEVEVTEKSNTVRWHAVVSWYSVNCLWTGWITKSDNQWHLTPEGKAALSLPANEFMAQLQQAKKQPVDVLPKPILHPVLSLTDVAAETGMPEPTLASWVGAIKRKGQAILAGPPGTGKTFCARWLAAHLVGGSDGVVDIVQFHPAYTYEDFIEGIRPQSKPSGFPDYPVVPGRFLKFLAEAEKRSGTSVLIIDEINRANLAQVFGELMYLLEYRHGIAGPAATPAKLKLANGGEISIPSKVVLLGTMNTADRSIALVDHALRRRFAILPLHPEYGILVAKCAENERENLGSALRLILEEINRALDDRHYHLGISFFLGVATAEQPLDLLASIWSMEIEPYLDEYFADQPETAKKFAWEQIKERLPG